jgi:hypothetical protein
MKRIIILEAVPGSAQGYRYALWAAVPAARQPFYANPSKVSAWRNASGAENTALQNGSVVERVESFNNAVVLTLAQVKSQLEARWTEYQDYVTAYNPWDRYGSFWDDTPAWTNGGV